MKDIRRSRRLRLPRRRYQLTKPITSDDNDESDLEHERFQQKSIAPSNKNANRMATTLFETISTLPIEEKQRQPLQISSDQSSLFLYSINSIQKPAISSEDLTPLTRTTTNATPLTALTFSCMKQAEIGTVKIDLTDLSGTDTLDSSSTSSDHDHSLSSDRKLSLANIVHQLKTTKDLAQVYDTDLSMKSATFSKKHSRNQERSYPKHASSVTIPNAGNGDCMIMSSPATIDANINTCPPSPIRWTLQNMTGKRKLLIGCSSLGLIAGILILVIIL